MKYAPRVSVIIVSHARAHGLARVLSALRYQTYAHFEIIVVADHDPSLPNIKYISYQEAHISKARNLGIEIAAGEIIAFCDDDAIPEPNWLARLVSPFEDPDIGVSGGYVRGRNGISFQWRALETDMNGNDHPMARGDDSSISIHTFGNKFAKVQGTNCAFRKSGVVDIGGFDPQFAFYLDETELTLRMGQAGWKTAIVPLAEVQHGFAPSKMRGADRTPRSLFQIGFSKAYFLNHYGDLAALDLFRAEQEHRLSRFLAGTKITKIQKQELLQSLEQGFEQGLQVRGNQFDLTPNAHITFQPAFPRFEKQGAAISGSLLRWRGMAKQAAQLAQNNIPTTLFCFTHSTLFHKRYFDSRGFWVQTGGVYGRSDRNDPLFTLHTTKSRAKREQELLKNQRDFSKNFR